MPSEPLTALQRTDPRGIPRWFHFHGPRGVIEAHHPEEVLPALREAVAARERGMHAVGWIAYEAAPGLDSRLTVHPPPSGEPVLRFSLFADSAEGLPPLGNGAFELMDPHPGLTEAEFTARVGDIRDAIARGETYQVNFTYPLTARFSGDARSLFRRMRLAQGARHQAFLEESDRILVSASPERFFRLSEGRALCRPMKGTARPGEEQPLRDSEKNRSENVMIVDMIRNDLGRVAIPGSVVTPGLFDIEAYPSLVQMTSTVEASGPEDPLPWLEALFPCASITGAPKRKTMEWIHRLEAGPRGVYTGCIGGFFADGVTEFNVAIRTLQIDRRTGSATYGTGCGIVWDSDPAAEYRESALKTAVLTHTEPDVHLIETMRAEPGGGILRANRHRARLLASASELGYEVNPDHLTQVLGRVAVDQSSRVRLMLSATGEITMTTTPRGTPPTEMTFRVDPGVTPSTHPDLKHKTTRRGVYEAARSRCPDVDETLMVNERGECMEFSIGNLVIEKDGHHLTPPAASGLLPGTARAGLLEEGVREAILRPGDVASADAVFLTNAVRGRVRMREVRS